MLVGNSVHRYCESGREDWRQESLGSKLALLLLLKILHIPAKFGFYISWKGIKVCAVSYGVILVLTTF